MNAAGELGAGVKHGRQELPLPNVAAANDAGIGDMAAVVVRLSGG